MKSTLFALGVGCAFLGTSCSTTDLGGSVPLPFTDPSTDAKLELELRPLPPRFCIGLDLIPRKEPTAEGEVAE